MSSGFAPIVELINAFQMPYDNAIATARTCYSSRLIYPQEVSRDEKALALKDKIGQSTYQAGHHTTLQHAHFQFALDKVSRLLIWSFLHAHPFYNSEQVSQRYVSLKAENLIIPPLPEKAHQIFESTALEMMTGYEKLVQLLEPTVQKEYLKIFPSRKLEEKRWAQVIRKKSQEAARYLAPLGMSAHLYHTISGLTLHRYHRLMHSFDTPSEEKILIQKMVDEVLKIDTEFMKWAEDPLPLEETPEYQIFERLHLKPDTLRAQTFIQEFDQSLAGKSSQMVDYKQNTEKTLANAVRTVFGINAELSDAQALEYLLSPKKNGLLSDTLNLLPHSKLGRVLNHAHFTFRKKLSHAADSQDQRHRLTPASRPVLAHQASWDRPDFITPVVIQASPAALDFYQESMHKVWKNLENLLSDGISHENLLYLLPNAIPIRFEESGDLIGFHHKWIHRLCYTAQEEIWQNCKDEVLQVKEKFPALGPYFAAPCQIRKEAGKKPFCPEGDRFCGIRVWEKEVSEYERVL